MVAIMFKLSLLIAALFFLIFIQSANSHSFAPQGDRIIVHGFCLYYEEAKTLADILVSNSEYETLNYFAAKDNSCYHKRTHPLKVFPAYVGNYMGYTAYSTMGGYGKKVRASIWNARAPDGTMVYVWFYVEEEKT